jgi:hypothetical protein
MVPWFQPYQNIRPFGVGTGVAHLSAFLPGNITIPCGMDMIIMEATFEASKDTNGALDLSFVGYLAADSTKPKMFPRFDFKMFVSWPPTSVPWAMPQQHGM